MSVQASPTLRNALEMEFTAAGVAEFQKLYDGTYTNNGIILFVETQTDDEIVYGGINHVTPEYRPIFIVTYYRNVLFSLDKEIIIGSGQTVTIKGTYADPDGGLPINAQDMITPEMNKDYTMYTATGGAGSNISSDLDLTSVVYGTEGFTHEVTNNNASVGYLNRYDCRGNGILNYNPIEHAATDSASISEFETLSESINQKYKNDLYSGSVFVESVVDEFKQPRTILNSISFCANRSEACMLAFLYTDIGDLRYISITELGITGNYYVQGINLEIKAGNIVNVKWIVKAIPSLISGLTSLAVEFRGGATKDGIEFPYLPRVSGDSVTKTVLSAWIYLDTKPDANDYFIIGPFVNSVNGRVLYVDGDATYRIIAYASARYTGPGKWTAPHDAFALSTWTHVMVYHDISVLTNDPEIYINGSLQSITEVLTPSGTLVSEVGNGVMLGTIRSGTIYGNSFDGKIFDPRVYNMDNTTLTAAQLATALYNGGTPDDTVATEGLVLQGFTIRDEKTADYIDQSLTSILTLRDNVFGAIGTPHASPIGRTAP
jgi:hypothetical protein